MSNTARFFVSVLICEGVGIIGSIFTSPSIGVWYANLIKPSFNPPNWIFGPVWTTLFFLMGISLYLIWTKGLSGTSVKIALIIFSTQLALNVLWSVLFFGMHSPLFALIDIVFLWLAILITILIFYPVSKTASLLMLPYLLWVSFASILNFFIVKLN